MAKKVNLNINRETKKHYTEIEKQNIFDEICEIIINGKSLRYALNHLSNGKHIHATDFFRWLREDENKGKQYARATEERAELIFEDIFDIADDSSNDFIEVDNIQKVNSEHIQRSRLRVDARKWALSKMMPKKYGDKLDITSDGEKLKSDIPAINLKIDGKDIELK